jgi:hypothetical protein
MARSTLAALIARERILINDVAGPNQQFSDDDIQAVMDESRIDLTNEPLDYVPTFSGSTIKYLDYYHKLDNWEDGMVLKQYLTVTVTPSAIEPIVGHWTFAQTTTPPVYVTGVVHDIYRAAADLLERWAARLVLNYDFSSDGQSFRRSQAATALQGLALRYRAKQLPRMISISRSDLVSSTESGGTGLEPRPIDFMALG